MSVCIVTALFHFFSEGTFSSSSNQGADSLAQHNGLRASRLFRNSVKIYAVLVRGGL